MLFIDPIPASLSISVRINVKTAYMESDSHKLKQCGRNKNYLCYNIQQNNLIVTVK